MPGYRPWRAACGRAVLTLTLIGTAGGVSLAQGTTFDDLRDALSRAVRAARYPASLSALVGLNAEGEVSGARLEERGSPTTTFDTLTDPLRSELEHGPFGEHWSFEATLGWSTARLEADDPAQSATTTKPWAVARLDATGSTGLRILDKPAVWGARLAYEHFLDDTGDLLGFDDDFELGASVAWKPEGAVPLFSAPRLRGGWIGGDDVRGFTFGLSASV